MQLLTSVSNYLPRKRFSDLGIDLDPVYVLGNYGSNEFTFIITDFVNTLIELSFGINLIYSEAIISIKSSYVFDLTPTFKIDFFTDQLFSRLLKTINNPPTFSGVTDETINNESSELHETEYKPDNSILWILLLYLLGITTLVAIEGIKAKDNNTVDEALEARRTAQANRVRRARLGLTPVNPQEGSSETEQLGVHDRLVTRPNPQED